MTYLHLTEKITTLKYFIVYGLYFSLKLAQHFDFHIVVQANSGGIYRLIQGVMLKLVNKIMVKLSKMFLPTQTGSDNKVSFFIYIGRLKPFLTASFRL